MKLISSFILTLALSAPVFSQQNKKAPHPGGPPTSISPEVEGRLEEYKNVVYATYGDRELELDWYRPKNAKGKKLPAIVCIHGGGWWQGNRQNHARLAKAVADNGFVTATISYRLSGEAPFPAAIHDCKAAVRFLRVNADKMGIEPEQIGAIGLSAGGHLTALLAASGGVAELEGEGGNADQSSTIQAAVPMGAQADFSYDHIQAVKRTPPPKEGEKPNLWTQFLGGPPGEVPETYKLASPITHLNAGDPPCHFIAGENDNDGTRAATFRDKAKELGIDEKLTIIPGAPHAFPGRQKYFDQAVVEAVAWFEAHLK